MGRVINPESAGKLRNQHMRTVAELIRLLGQKPSIDADARDMVAKIIFCLREIDSGIEASAEAWEKRDYYMKAEELRQRWSWAGRVADELQAVVFSEQWDRLPQYLVKIFPHVSDIRITKFMRKEEDWRGEHMRLMLEKPPSA
ncbi:hypothetical protein FBR02_04330 [Anaerolineae bacterium CFX9]|jgi:hypothetical protein|nr:hypothetical protein [Anaerolineae bacterium CFX9]